MDGRRPIDDIKKTNREKEYMNDNIKTEWVSVRCPLCDRMIQDVGIKVDSGTSSGINTNTVCLCGATVMVYADFDTGYISISGAVYDPIDAESTDEEVEGRL